MNWVSVVLFMIHRELHFFEEIPVKPILVLPVVLQRSRLVTLIDAKMWLVVHGAWVCRTVYNILLLVMKVHSQNMLILIRFLKQIYMWLLGHCCVPINLCIYLSSYYNHNHNKVRYSYQRIYSVGVVEKEEATDTKPRWNQTTTIGVLLVVNIFNGTKICLVQYVNSNW
jgi:hypothetical protein